MRKSKRIYGLGLALAAFLLAAAPAHAERPIADFARSPALESPRLSPDGTKVAALASVNGEQAMVTIDAADGAVIASVPLGGQELDWLHWVNSEWLVGRVTVNVARNAMGVDTSTRATRLLAFKSDGSDAHFVMPAGGDVGQLMADVLWYATDGSPRILLSFQTSFDYWKEGFRPEVDMVDVARNSFHRVVFPKEGVYDWYADGEGNVRLGLGVERDGKGKRAIYREGGSGNFREIANGSYEDELIVPYAFSEEGGKAFTMSSKDGFTALYDLDLATMKPTKLLYKVDGYDLSTVIFDNSEKRVLGVSWTDTKPHTAWLDPMRASLQTLLDAKFPGRAVSIVSASNNEQKFVIHVGSAASPGAFYVTDTKGDLIQLAVVNPSLGMRSLAQMRTIAYSARDGMQLNAVLTLPPGREAKNLPVIVMPHGGPRARDDESWDWWVQFLADRGYAVIQPNYRGSEGFGDAYVGAGDGEWGLKMQDDVDDALAWLGAQGIGDTKRACIVGGSYGGYVAEWAAERNPELYRCAVSFAGVSDLQAMIKYDKGFIGGMGTAQYWRTRAPDLAAVSPLNAAEKAAIPLLIVHGKKDIRVPFEQSSNLVDRLNKAGKTVEFEVQPLGDHHFSREEDRVSFLTWMEAFLDKYNPAT